MKYALSIAALLLATGQLTPAFAQNDPGDLVQQDQVVFRRVAVLGQLEQGKRRTQLDSHDVGGHPGSQLERLAWSS